LTSVSQLIVVGFGKQEFEASICFIESLTQFCNVDLNSVRIFSFAASSSVNTGMSGGVRP
jgi:hypothetical protein